VNSLADTLWTLVRWAVPVTVAGVVAAGAIGSSRIGEEVRGRVEARLAKRYAPEVHGAHAHQIEIGHHLQKKTD
jgi:hypothetical protein